MNTKRVNTKLLSVLLALSMMVTLFPITAYAINSSNGYNYSVFDETLSDGRYRGIGIHSIDASIVTGDITIPSSIAGRKVTDIGYRAFKEQSQITSVTIPDTITNLDNAAFISCTGLTSVTLGNGVPRIGEGVFSGCTSLKTVNFGSSVTKIEREAFSGCTSLKSITIPNTITTIGYGAFQNCTGLTSITIPDSVTSIAHDAFNGCTNLTSVIIGSGITSIEYGTFRNCKGLTSINIPDTVTSIGNHAFRDCDKLQSVTIGSGVTSIGENAFSNGFALNSITIPNNVTTIGARAFENCNKMSSLTISNKVTALNDNTFSKCSALTSVTIPSSVTTLGKQVFMDCSALTSVSIPNSVTSIGSEAFARCPLMTSVVIPDSVTKIEGQTFENCSELKSVTIPISVANIGWNAFNGCYRLNTVNYSGTEQQWNAIAIDSGNDYLKYASVNFGQVSCEHKNKVTVKENKIVATYTNDGSYDEVVKCSDCGEELSRTKKTTEKASNVKLSTDTYTYSGTVKTPSVTVKTSKGVALKKDIDYTVKYASGRKNIGKYSVTVTLKGNYGGTKTLYFTIVPKTTSKISVNQTTSTIKASWSKVSGVTGYRAYIYKGNKLVNYKTLSNKYSSYTFSKLSSGTAYTIKVKAYKKVSGTTYWSAAKSLATATKTVTPKITKITAGKKYATIYLGSVSGESGYQVYYSTSKNGSYKKGATTSANATKATVKSLISGKTYYFKIRTYKKTSSKTVYSSWSTIKYVKVK